MIRNNKKLMLITSLLTLLPIPVGLLLWDRFPAAFQQNKFFLIYLPPLSMLAAHWLCAVLTDLDPGNKGRNRKPLKMVLWIIPFTTWFCCGLMYALYLGLKFSPTAWTLGLMGLMFVVIGNYMPKIKMNSTLGIRIPWTYSSEENWRATHRFAGPIWVAGGLLMILGIFLPEGAAIAVMFLSICILVLVPSLYSYRFWKHQKAEGVELKAALRANTTFTKVAMVFLALLLIFVLAILFTGNIDYAFGAESFTIEADWYSDMTVRYDAIQAIEYREDNVDGIRVNGFGSLRLLMGYFSNTEFGTHIRYTYYKPDACIVAQTDTGVLVLSGKTVAETASLYETLLDKIG